VVAVRCHITNAAARVFVAAVGMWRRCPVVGIGEKVYAHRFAEQNASLYAVRKVNPRICPGGASVLPVAQPGSAKKAVWQFR